MPGRVVISGGAASTARPCTCERVPVLCGCGWGMMGLLVCRVPERCPVCGFDFWEAFGPPEPCSEPEGGAS